MFMDKIIDMEGSLVKYIRVMDVLEYIFVSLNLFSKDAIPLIESGGNAMLEQSVSSTLLAPYY